jgi:hypothetical protein
MVEVIDNIKNNFLKYANIDKFSEFYGRKYIGKSNRPSKQWKNKSYELVFNHIF